MVKIEGNIHREIMKCDKKKLQHIFRHTTMLVLSMVKLQCLPLFFPSFVRTISKDTTLDENGDMIQISQKKLLQLIDIALQKGRPETNKASKTQRGGGKQSTILRPAHHERKPIWASSCAFHQSPGYDVATCTVSTGLIIGFRKVIIRRSGRLMAISHGWKAIQWMHQNKDK